MSFGSSKKKKSQRKGLSLTTSAPFLISLQHNGRFTNLFVITLRLQLQVLLTVAIYNSHVQWKIKSITFAVSALLRNSEARLLIGFVWNHYRQFYFKHRGQFYLCLKRNADEPKDWSRCPDHSFGHANWYCLVKKTSVFALISFLVFLSAMKGGSGCGGWDRL